MLDDMSIYTEFKAFVSYSHKDSGLVHGIVHVIRAAGQTVFCDLDSIEPGIAWEQRITDTLSNTTDVLVFWSESASKSTEVQKEWSLALSLGKKTIPILLDDTPLVPELSALNAVDLRHLIVRSVPRQSHTSTSELVLSSPNHIVEAALAIIQNVQHYKTSDYNSAYKQTDLEFYASWTEQTQLLEAWISSERDTLTRFRRNCQLEFERCLAFYKLERRAIVEPAAVE